VVDTLITRKVIKVLTEIAASKEVKPPGQVDQVEKEETKTEEEKNPEEQK
jgi:hypothetical protein